MADSSVAITAGAGTNIDTRTEPGGDHRQVVVIGDPVTASVASVNTGGALMVQGLQSTATTLNVTTSSSTSGTLACSGYNVATVTITGTYAGINLTFEVSLDNGSTWVPVNGAQLDAGVVTTAGATGVITTNASRGWDIAVGAADAFRVRSTAFTSGTGVVKVAFQTLPYEPAPVAQISGTVPVSGTLTSAGTTTATPVTPTPNNVTSAATTNGTLVKASAGTVYSVTASNTGAAAAYLKLYNLAAAPTVGTSVPVLTISLPASGTVNVSFGATGHRFATGISLAITNLAADSDATAIAAAQVKVLTSYI